MEVTRHVPVLYQEVLESFNFPGSFLDCTLGGGGHTEGLLKAHPDNQVWALDRDGRAIERAQARLSMFAPRLNLVHTAFGDIDNALGERRFSGLLADLGMSTDQLYEGRGFSFQDDAPLDMRMDESQSLTADEVVNGFTEGKLLGVMKRGGVGREAWPLVKAIVNERPIVGTRALAQLVARIASKKKKGQARGSHPATVVFQAIRIEVNGELTQIRELMDKVPALIKPGGRVAIISFHSLEDKEVTRVMRSWAQGDTTPARLMTQPGKLPQGKLLTRKAIVPSSEEIERNPASRSAMLRVFEFRGEG